MGRLLSPGDGRLFVLRGSGLIDEYSETDAGQMFDVFDEQGSHVAVLRLPDRVRLRAASGHRLFGIHVDELGVSRLVALEAPGLMR